MDAFTVRPFRNGGSQAIRLPNHLRIESGQILIWRDPVTHNLILSRQPEDWLEVLNLVRFMPPPDFPHGQRIRRHWTDQFGLGMDRWSKNLPFDQFDEFAYLDEAGEDMPDEESATETRRMTAGQRFHLASDAVRDLFNGHMRFAMQLQRVPIQNVGVSAIVAGQVEFGWRKYPQAGLLRSLCYEFLRCAAVMPWDRSAAAVYGELGAALLHDDICFDAHELLIAAHALAQQATLVTRNPRYRQIPALRTVDWTQL